MLVVSMAFLLVGSGESAKLLFKELMDKGIPIPAGATVRLPPPWMKEGLTGQEQQAVLKKAAGSHPLDLFLKKTDAAPFSLVLRSVDNSAGSRVAQTIDLAFVAYGNLDKVAREDVLNQL